MMKTIPEFMSSGESMFLAKIADPLSDHLITVHIGTFQINEYLLTMHPLEGIEEGLLHL